VSTGPAAAAPIREPRWAPGAALLIYMALNVVGRIWLPRQGAVRVPWLVPALEALLLIAVLADVSRLARRTPWVRRIAITLVVVLVAAALWATVLLVYDLIKGHGVTNSPTKLLASGALIWLGNNLAFGLLYWLMDAGGRWRAHKTRRRSTSPSHNN
jgi:hypothetical protein